MAHSAQSLMQVNAEIRVPTATAQLVRFDTSAPADNILCVEDAYWLDLCLTPRPPNARARYRDHWGPQRFERLGTVFLLPAGEALQARSDRGDAQISLLCHLKSESLREWFDGDLQWTDRRLEASLDIPEASVRNLLLRLAEELRHPGFASATLVELMTAQLAIELSRYCTRIDDTADAGGLATWRLRLIDERVRELREAPSLGELAGLCGISVRQLTRGFRASRGRSIGDYVAGSRLEHARELLATEQSIKAVAYTLGFSSPSSFCYAFRRDTGETPGQYRQRLHAATERIAPVADGRHSVPESK